jgi:hypothetical protein
MVAYFATALSYASIMFITLDPCVNVNNLFSFVKSDGAKKAAVVAFSNDNKDIG